MQGGHYVRPPLPPPGMIRQKYPGADRVKRMSCHHIETSQVIYIDWYLYDDNLGI